MGENSKISWTDNSWNPFIGCTKVSDGCRSCYAEDMMDKRYGKVKWEVCEDLFPGTDVVEIQL
jgi:protein gp37